MKTRRDAVNERNTELGLPASRFTKSDGAGEAQRAFRYLTAIFNSFKKDFVGGKLRLPDGNPCDVLADKKVRKVLKPRNFYLTDEAIETLKINPINLEKVDADKSYIAKKYGLSVSQLNSILAEPPRYYTDFPNQKKFIDFCYRLYNRYFNKSRV